MTDINEVIAVSYQCLTCDKKYYDRCDPLLTWEQYTEKRDADLFICQKCDTPCPSIAFFEEQPDDFDFEKIKKEAEEVAKEAEKKYISDKRMEHLTDISKDLKPISSADFSNPTKDQKENLKRQEDRDGKIVLSDKNKEQKPINVKFAQISCQGCSYKETKPLDPPMHYVGFCKWRLDFKCPECGASCLIFEKEYKEHYGPSKEELETNFSEFRDTVYYQINIKPVRYVLAFKGLNHLVEATISINIKDNDIDYRTTHNKIYLTAIPTKISRHKNPISIIRSAQKYSMSFVNQNNEQLTFKHLTLAGILSELKNHGHVSSDGADMALGCMIQAYIENKIIEDNNDISYEGFIIDDETKQIIASNIKTTNPNVEKLNDAFLFLEELKPYYEGRLDLLATSMVWVMFAPLNFMLKHGNYFLKWFHFHGASNATKSNTGRLMLAVDGHHDNTKYLLNIGNIDTIARLGSVIEDTTFPKLVDEVDLNGDRMTFLVNNIKSAIDHQIFRSKYPNSQASTTEEKPSMSPLIFTSNPSPPNDDAYMRRIIDRAFPNSESKKEDDPISIEFKNFLNTNLKRLKSLGDFRNWFVMNNQDIILDESRPEPLDLGYLILSEAYKFTGKVIPYWLSLRLPENQLEQSMEDSATMVKRAFEKYIDEQVNRALQVWKTWIDSGEDGKIELPIPTSGRLLKLAKSNLLPDIKITRRSDVVITRGILTELYNHGVTRDQCSNLHTLSDYMGGNYKPSNGRKVISITGEQLFKYFDAIE